MTDGTKRYDRLQRLKRDPCYWDFELVIACSDVSCLFLGPAILLWDWLPGSESYDYRSCGSPFAKNFLYLVTTAFVEFFVPFFSITILNLLVYINIRQRSHGLVRTDNIKLKSNDYHVNLLDENKQAVPGLTSSTNYSKSSSSSSSLARDRKAAKNLFILVFAFVICWCPYTFLTLIRALCKYQDRCVSPIVYEITFWLLWFNSTINPLLYSFLHVKFRKAFYEILCFYKHQHRHRLRTDQI